MTLTKLLAGTLALVLVAGMTSPAFAGMQITECTITQNQMVDTEIAENEEILIPKTIECDQVIQGFSIGASTCVNNTVLGSRDLDGIGTKVITFDEVILNQNDTSEEHCTQQWSVLGSGSQVFVIQELWFNVPIVAGELLSLDTSALMVAGLTSSAVWMVPAVAGLAGVGVYLVKFRKQ